jgi:hypothetical protein
VPSFSGETQDMVTLLSADTKHCVWRGQVKNVLDFNEVFLNGDLGELGDGGNLQFFHDIVFMGLYGLGTDTQAFGDFPGR